MHQVLPYKGTNVLCRPFAPRVSVDQPQPVPYGTGWSWPVEKLAVTAVSFDARRVDVWRSRLPFCLCNAFSVRTWRGTRPPGRASSTFGGLRRPWALECNRFAVKRGHRIQAFSIPRPLHPATFRTPKAFYSRAQGKSAVVLTEADATLGYGHHNIHLRRRRYTRNHH